MISHAYRGPRLLYNGLVVHPSVIGSVDSVVPKLERECDGHVVVGVGLEDSHPVGRGPDEGNAVVFASSTTGSAKTE